MFHDGKNVSMVDTQPLFGWLTLSVITLGICSFEVFAEWIDIFLVAMRVPGSSVVIHRGREFMFLWLIVCSLYGWGIVYWRSYHRWTVRPIYIVLPPLVFGLFDFAYNLPKKYDLIVTLPPQEYFVNVTVTKWLIILGSIIPAVQGGLIGSSLLFQARIWRRRLYDGKCPKCEYDLTGNVSGKCPECGEPVPQQCGHDNSTTC